MLNTYFKRIFDVAKRGDVTALKKTIGVQEKIDKAYQGFEAETIEF